jgi:hypothetical protein
MGELTVDHVQLLIERAAAMRATEAAYIRTRQQFGQAVLMVNREASIAPATIAAVSSVHVHTVRALARQAGGVEKTWEDVPLFDEHNAPTQTDSRTPDGPSTASVQPDSAETSMMGPVGSISPFGWGTTDNMIGGAGLS